MIKITFKMLHHEKKQLSRFESEKKLKIKVQVCTHLEREVPGPGLREEAVSLAEALHDQALDVVYLEKE